MLNLYVKLSMLRSLAADRASRESGATAVEYGVMVALIIAVVIAVVATLGEQILQAFNAVSSQLGGGGGGNGNGG